MIIDKLIEKIIQRKNPSVVGLDPTAEIIPNYIKDKYVDAYGETNLAMAYAIIDFNKGIIDGISDIVPAVKPQIAFYESYGVEGMKAYQQTIEYAKSKGLIVIGDIKRGDIGSTCEGYAKGHFYGDFEADIVTLNPYLGYDSIEPFNRDKEKGAFVLIKTSNKSSKDLQDLEVDGYKVYELVAQRVTEWGGNSLGKYGYSNLGGVVGATYPEEGEKIRRIMKNSYLLVPGYGAQGGGAKDVVNLFNNDGLGAIVNSSRGIIAAYKKGYQEQQYTEAARQAAISMREDITKALEEAGKGF